jgi:phage terminase large subunit-like protein
LTGSFKLTAKQEEANAFLASGKRNLLLAGGARSGKTFLMTRAIVYRAVRAPKSRHAILRLRSNAAWTTIGLDTLPKVMSLCAPKVPFREARQDKFFELPNGSQIWIGGLDDKERVEKILGMEFATIYLNEASQIPYSSYLIARTRLAQTCEQIQQRLYVDLNPSGTGHWTYRMFLQGVDPDTRRPLPDAHEFGAMFLNPGDNAENLTEAFLRDLENLPARQRKRFFEGKFSDDIDGALWPLETIDRCRCTPDEVPALRRVVVAIDPSGASGKEDKRSDDVGIIVAGDGVDGKAYILADRTCQLSPAGWARVAINAYREFKADAIVAERNYGGAMVEHTIRTADPLVKYIEVTASRGKVVRAEPVSALYDEKIDKVRHVGRFDELEDQMANFSTSGYMGERSPDRVDALVWAINELKIEGSSYDSSLSWVG